MRARPVPPELDRRNIERMAQWPIPRGSLSRQMLALLKRLDALEDEVQRLRAGTLPDLR